MPKETSLPSTPTPVPVADGGAHRVRRRPAYLAGMVLVLCLTAACMISFFGLMNRERTDSGSRVWLLNHTPDQVVIINPFAGIVEKTLLVADGLRGLVFSRDYSKAYIYNVVDVSNRLTVLDSRTYLPEEVIEVDGVPQGIGVFPDNDKLAVILGSKSDFMAGGFDVISLKVPSKADPKKKKRLYRERDMQLTHKIAVGDDGDRIYCIDAKSSKINIFSLREQQLIAQLDLQGAAEEMLYPRVGNYYYVSVLQHNAIYQINKVTDGIEAVYIHEFQTEDGKSGYGKLRYMAIDSKARYLFAPVMEKKYVAIWDLKDRQRNLTPWEDVPFYPDIYENAFRFEGPHYTPLARFKLKGGYNPSYKFVPGGKQVAVDPTGEYLFVVDEYGALYVYLMQDVLKAEDLSTPEPHKIVAEIEDDTTEVRDIKVSQPAIGSVVATE